VTNQFTDQAVGADPAGGISGVPTFRLDVFAPGELPAGRYTVGVACTLGVPSLTQVTSYWSTTVSVAAEGAPPSAPGTPVVTVGVGTLAVMVVPSTTGGTPASYTVTATGVSPATPDRTCTVTGASGSCTITGLSTSGRYRVSVVATNASGSSSPSPPWPAAPQVLTPGSGSSTPQFPDIAPTRSTELIRATSMLKLREISTAPQYFPASSVTRSQMAVFLWRMGGRDTAPSSCGLTDMGAEGPQANQAVCWLLGQRITQVSGRYNPSGTVTRSQMALFMWRFAGEPGKDDPSKTGECGVQDVTTEGPQARKAICWMKENGITAVTTSYFPNGLVDRGSMGLFLGRLGATLGLWVAPSVPS